MKVIHSHNLILSVITIALFSCIGCSNSRDKERIEELETTIANQEQLSQERIKEIESKYSEQIQILNDTISKLKKDLNKFKENQSSNNSSDSSNKSFVGTYEFTDQYGTTWVLDLISGGRATIHSKNSSRKAYGTFRFFSGGPTIYFEDDVPRVLFPNYNEGGAIMTISSDSEYIYETREAARAGNPRQRLRITKTN